jgi:PAS domain S-box-containing protein
MEPRPAILDDLQYHLADTLNRFSIVAITDAQGRILYANDNFCKISEYSREDLIGKTHRVVSSGVHSEEFIANLWNIIHAGQTWRGEVCNRNKKGEMYWVDTHISPIVYEGEKYFIAVRNDITARKEAESENIRQEKQLLQADKMTSLGILTSGVAHEINNPNHLIMSNNELLEKVWLDVASILESVAEEDGDFELAGIPYSEMKHLIPQMFDRIRGGAERIRNIVDGLKHFAREDHTGLDQVVHLNEIVDRALPLVESLLRRSTVNFHLKLGKKLPPIKGSFQQIEQIFINFVTNSCQALSSKHQAIVVMTEYDAKEDKVRLVVRDEGRGIPAELVKKVMDPFFTTKHDDGGTGLGLFVSYGIVQRHKGHIQFDAKEGRGCTVTVSLPAYRENLKNISHENIT